MAESMLAQLAGQGVLGVFLALVLIALWQKDKDLKAEQRSRVEDAQRMLTIAMSLQKDVQVAVGALTAIMEKWEERMEERERLVAPPVGRR